jgi:hypothetical protein
MGNLITAFFGNLCVSVTVWGALLVWSVTRLILN